MTTSSPQRRSRVIAAMLALGLALVPAILAWPADASRGDVAGSSPRAQTTPSPTPRTHTGPGLDTGAGKDAVSSRAVRGLVFLVIAVGVVGVLFRVRVRDWMLGRSGAGSGAGRRDDGADRGPDA